MKTIFLFLFITLISIHAFSQQKNNIAFIYGVNNNSIDNHNDNGGYSGYNNQSGRKFGLSYTRNLNRFFSIETGLLFADNKAQTSLIAPVTYPIMAGPGPGGLIITNGDIKMLSIPLLAKFTFFKYVYVDAGLVADFETNYSNYTIANDQSGIGYEVGIGGKYSWGHFCVFVNPFVTVNGLILFNSTSSNNLLEAGAKFGLGYNF